MWKELDNKNMSWLKKQVVGMQWKIANICRHIKTEKSIIKGIARWRKLQRLCKNINKSLLRKAKEEL